MPVLFSYGGWQNGTYIAGEMKRPQRDLPLALIGGTLVVIACYVLANLAYLRVMTPEAIASSRRFAGIAARASLGGCRGHVGSHRARVERARLSPRDRGKSSSGRRFSVQHAQL